MEKITVQARWPGFGHDFCWRAGRRWPAREPVVVEVWPQDDDPPPLVLDRRGEPVSHGRFTTLPDPHRIGRRTLAALLADSRLEVRPYLGAA